MNNIHRFFIGLALFLSLATQAADTQTQATHRVELKTDLGIMVAELYGKQAPHTVENFLSLVEEGFYNGVIFHRVIPGFVAQAGGYTFDFQHKPSRPSVINESANGLKNSQGTLAMARTSDPDSASTQFYINLRDNPSLNAAADKPGYTVFGKLIKGFEVAEKIALEPRGQYRAFPQAPNVPVRILEARVIQADETEPARTPQ